MDPNNPPRWAADPTGRHQYRYWDGSGWTDQVSDNGSVSTDPPVASPPGSGAAPPVPPFVPSPPTSSAPWHGTQDSTAVLGRRYGAFFIDVAICIVAFIILFMAFATQRTVAETLRLPGCHYASSSSSFDSSRQIECDNRAVFRVNDTVYEAEIGPTFGLFIVFTLLYFMLPEALVGASLGKAMTGIRVVRPDGSRIGIGRSLLRWLLFWVDGPLTLYLCGIISSSVSRGHRRVGDMAAGSYVVGKDTWGKPVSLPS
jgi:uncharacterized RDD family membrane protein YckC